MSTGRAHPQPSLGGPRLGPVAGGAHELLPPAEPRQVLAARVLGREARVELPERARVVLHSLNHYRLGLLESRTYPNGPMGVFPLHKSLLPVVVAFLLPTTDTLDHRRVGNGTHRHGLFQEPMEELPAMA